MTKTHRRTIGLPAVLLLPLILVVAGCDAVYLGLQVEAVTGESRTAVQITEVDAGSPADAAGIAQDDIIVRFNQKDVSSLSALREELASIAIGETFSIKVYRLSTADIVEATITLTGDPSNLPTSLGMNIADSSSPAGVKVVSVDSGKAADDAGLIANDVITQFGDTTVSGADQFRAALAQVAEDSSVTVTYSRAGSDEESTTLTVGFDAVSRMPVLGVAAQDLSADLAKQLGYPGLSGARVTSALITSPAFEAGVMPRDIIFRFGNREIDELSDLTSAVNATGGIGTVEIGHTRAGDILVTDVTLAGPLSGNDYTLSLGLALAETTGGLQIVEVVSGSVAESADLQLDDVITAVNGTTVTTPQEFHRQVLAVYDTRPRPDGVSLSTTRSGVSVTRFLFFPTSSSSGSDSTGGSGG